MNAIEVEGVAKTYRIPHERHTTLVERLLSVFRPMPVEILPALADVTLAIPAGSFVGIIGSNGSGKSTLLKLMAGLLVPDAGIVRVNGTLAPLLELGLGFQNELTIHENVVLYGAVLGYPRHEMARRVDEAIAFAELQRFRDAKLKSLSSGMLARLAFATALGAEADILLLDEVLAVGDAHFQQKCFGVFDRLRGRGKTIVLVTHDLASVQRFCERVYWLDRGRLALEGAADVVINTYLAMSQAIGQTFSAGMDEQQARDYRWGDRRVHVVEGRLETEAGDVVHRVLAGTRVVLRLLIEAREPSAAPVIGFLVRLANQTVYSTNNALLEAPAGPFAAGDRADIRIPFTLALANGVYVVNVAIADRTSGTIHDWINHFIKFSVEGSRASEGPADLGAEFECRPCAPTRPEQEPSVARSRQ
ncbi:MAG TPA: ABC transporter ATP-binding protein [Candidatus Binatia bacterium]|nr:ABC transporter ATP-binding protein [Candidatus Binatia bacterium]